MVVPGLCREVPEGLRLPLPAMISRGPQGGDGMNACAFAEVTLESDRDGTTVNCVSKDPLHQRVQGSGISLSKGPREAFLFGSRWRPRESLRRTGRATARGH